MNPENQASILASPLCPYLIVKDAAKAIEFYKKVFQAREKFRLTEPQGKIGHAELQIGHSVFMLADEYPDFNALGPLSIGGSPVTIHLYVDDVDKTIEQALSTGAILLRPIKDEFFGERSGMIVDPFGHKWHLATRKEDISVEEMQKRWNSMFDTSSPLLDKISVPA